jgi:hypothetical protein
VEEFMSMPLTQEAWDEMEAERTAEPWSMAGEHREWHRWNGPGNCPWDACPEPEPYQCPICGDYLDFDPSVHCLKPECVEQADAHYAAWLIEVAARKAAEPNPDPWAADVSF